MHSETLIIWTYIVSFVASQIGSNITDLRYTSSVSTIGSLGLNNIPNCDFPDGFMSDTDSEPEVLDMMEFDIQSKEGRLPDSSYPEEEAWLTWADITGHC